MESGKVISYERSAELFFKAGLKYADKKQYDKALRLLERAVQIEPFKSDYLFNLATIYAELRETDKSNTILVRILRDIDPTLTECYFAIGCNYFDSNDLKKAGEYFEKYVTYDPYGLFAEEAYDILYYIKFYGGLSHSKRKRKNSARLLQEGKKLLAEMRFDEAKSKLEEALEEEPHAVEARNDLAVVCFLAGDLKRAISLEKSVLILQPENTFSLCNLAILYSYERNTEKMKEQINLLTGLGMDFRAQFQELMEMYKKLCKGTGTVNAKRIYGSIKKISGEVIQKNALWEKELDRVIECAMNNKEFTYRSGYEKELRNIWMDYIRKINPGEVPVIRKREVWAAALEYIYCSLNLIRVSKNSLAKKYNVSPASITRRLKSFDMFFGV